MPVAQWRTLPRDRSILRDLGKRKRAIADEPTNCERREAWFRHDARDGGRPMVLAESEVAFEDLPDSRLHCEEDWAREVERALRFEIFQFERIKDDHVVEPVLNCPWRVECSDYGVQSKQHYADWAGGNVTSRRWEPPVKDLDEDFGKLKPRTYSVDRDASLGWRDHLADVFEAILPVRVRGSHWWTTGMTITAIDLVGLENLMLYMCTNPDGVHRLMAFLRDDTTAFAQWLEREGLLSLNNENDYIGSGSMGYTAELPQPDRCPDDGVRLRDLWVLSESQETSEVGPDMFEEFVFQYQQPIIERFGLAYYGCCEGLHHKWSIISRLSNLRRVSVSPWCDQKYMAGALGRDYVFSRKPNPTLISTPHFDEDAIRSDLRETLSLTREGALEVVMKDVHTLSGEPHRLARWVQLARETAGQMA